MEHGTGVVNLLAFLAPHHAGPKGEKELDHLAKSEMDVHCGGVSLHRLFCCGQVCRVDLVHSPTMDELPTRAPIGGRRFPLDGPENGRGPVMMEGTGDARGVQVGGSRTDPCP